MSATPRRLLLPLSRFLQTEALGGTVLLIATLAAMAWANSPWSDSYEKVWNTRMAVGLGDFMLNKPLILWINDGLMAIFFFVVGLEIKRELLIGELASLRNASLPVAAAIGGMVAPAALYALLNIGSPGIRGWGVPMATDIAFALGVLALLGDRVPAGLKIFLAALAIVDDLGAVLVIAIFYTEGISWSVLTLGSLLLLASFAMNRAGVRKPLAYALIGIMVWIALLKSGVHATVAGVLMAFTIPPTRRIDTISFIREGRGIIDEFERVDDPTPLTNDPQRALVRELETRCEAVQAPLQRIEHVLHPWVSFVIMPLFALANAGIALDAQFIDAVSDRIGMGVIAGLLIGKPLGVFLASWLAVRIGVAALPSDTNWTSIFGASCLAGIGFTMSMFIAGLAFENPASLSAAKAGVLSASIVAGCLGYCLLKRAVRTKS